MPSFKEILQGRAHVNNWQIEDDGLRLNVIIIEHLHIPRAWPSRVSTATFQLRGILLTIAH